MELSEANRQKLLIICAILTLICVFSSFILFMCAVYVKHNIDSRIALLETYNSDAIPGIFLFVAVINLVQNISCFFICMKLRDAEKRERLLTPLLVVLVGGVILVALELSSTIASFVQVGVLDREFGDGLNRAMKQYGKGGELKREMDNVQSDYRCCGDKGYTDWFVFSWLDPSYLVTDRGSVKKFLQKDGKYYSDDTPFSCCDMRSPRPCVHHHIHDNHRHHRYNFREETTIYTTGCREVLMAVYGHVLISVGLIALVIASVKICVLLIVRLLQTSLKQAKELHDWEATTQAYIYYLKQGTDQSAVQDDTVVEDSDGTPPPPTEEEENTDQDEPEPEADAGKTNAASPNNGENDGDYGDVSEDEEVDDAFPSRNRNQARNDEFTRAPYAGDFSAKPQGRPVRQGINVSYYGPENNVNNAHVIKRDMNVSRKIPQRSFARVPIANNQSISLPQAPNEGMRAKSQSGFVGKLRDRFRELTNYPRMTHRVHFSRNYKYSPLAQSPESESYDQMRARNKQPVEKQGNGNINGHQDHNKFPHLFGRNSLTSRVLPNHRYTPLSSTVNGESNTFHRIHNHDMVSRHMTTTPYPVELGLRNENQSATSICVANWPKKPHPMYRVASVTNHSKVLTHSEESSPDGKGHNYEQHSCHDKAVEMKGYRSLGAPSTSTGWGNRFDAQRQPLEDRHENHVVNKINSQFQDWRTVNHIQKVPVRDCCVPNDLQKDIRSHDFKLVESGEAGDEVTPVAAQENATSKRGISENSCSEDSGHKTTCSPPELCSAPDVKSLRMSLLRPSALAVRSRFPVDLHSSKDMFYNSRHEISCLSQQDNRSTDYSATCNPEQNNTGNLIYSPFTYNISSPHDMDSRCHSQRENRDDCDLIPINLRRDENQTNLAYVAGRVLSPAERLDSDMEVAIINSNISPSRDRRRAVARPMEPANFVDKFPRPRRQLWATHGALDLPSFLQEQNLPLDTNARCHSQRNPNQCKVTSTRTEPSHSTSSRTDTQPTPQLTGLEDQDIPVGQQLARSGTKVSRTGHSPRASNLLMACQTQDILRVSPAPAMGSSSPTSISAIKGPRTPTTLHISELVLDIPVATSTPKQCDDDDKAVSQTVISNMLTASLECGERKNVLDNLRGYQTAAVNNTVVPEMNDHSSTDQAPSHREIGNLLKESLNTKTIHETEPRGQPLLCPIKPTGVALPPGSILGPSVHSRERILISPFN